MKRKLKKKWKILLSTASALVVIPLIILLLIHFAPQPPTGDMEYARLALSQAASSNAGTYSKNLYSEAKVLYDSAMTSWKRENRKFVYFRHYDSVSKYAALSARKAEQAMENSRISATNLKIQLRQKIDSLNELSLQLDKFFSTYPLTSHIRSRISKGNIYLKESEVAYSKGQYLQSNKRLTEAEYLLTDSYQNATNNLREYFKSYPVWRKWVENTINESRQNRCYSIIVDKYSRKCLVYYSGVKKYEYEVELGKNWVGDKKIKGDHATPEGMYRIVKKFDSNKTKYFKALLLDYPNDRDKAEFRQEVASGELPPSARIGGLIEIHGNGGKGVDWTEGCIALADPEMAVIFKIAREGTPVTIVGSMVDLKQVMD
jgi:L,D-peptidoglycan transpeptidase YkuD (ErfK/YbiS/YcfS/YnhG family)